MKAEWMRHIIRKCHKNAVHKGLLEGYSDIDELKEATFDKLKEEVLEFFNSEPSEAFSKDSEQSEIADIIMVLFTYSYASGIDLVKAIEEKLQFNQSRPRKHGK